VPCPAQQILDEEKAKHAGLAQQNGYGPAFFHRMLRLAKCTANPTPAIDWLDCLIGPGWLLLGSSFPPFLLPVSVLWVRLGNCK
jgi:hypothetical protein